MLDQGRQGTITIDTTYGLNLRTGNRLAIGNDSQRFHSSSRQPGSHGKTQQGRDVASVLRSRHALHLLAESLQTDATSLVLSLVRQCLQTTCQALIIAIRKLA